MTSFRREPSLESPALNYYETPAHWPAETLEAKTWPNPGPWRRNRPGPSRATPHRCAAHSMTSLRLVPGWARSESNDQNLWMALDG